MIWEVGAMWYQYLYLCGISICIYVVSVYIMYGLVYAISVPLCVLYCFLIHKTVPCLNIFITEAKLYYSFVALKGS